MNQSQVKYARKRLQELYDRKLEDFEKNLPAKKKSLTVCQKLQAIRSNKAKKLSYIPTPRYGGSPDLVDCYTYPSESKIKEFNTKRENRLRKFTRSLSEEKTRIEDKLVLGDSKEALKLLDSFAKKGPRDFA